MFICAKIQQILMALKNFKCKQCGSCCHSPRLYKEDILRIRQVGYNEDDFVYTDNFGVNYLKDKDKKCMFLKKGKTNSCLIYENRPKICRLYPSELANGSCKPVELAFDKYLEGKRIKEAPNG